MRYVSAVMVGSSQCHTAAVALGIQDRLALLTVHTQSVSSVCPYRDRCPPAKQSTGPYGLTTILFCEGLYLPRIIGLSLISISSFPANL